jgi:uncharacterized protein YjiS (DUF1127 family)
MRFEESVNRYVARFPELALYRQAQPRPRVGYEEIRRGVARGRALHGRFCRQVINTLLVGPLVTALGVVGRALAATKTKLRAERMRLATIHSLAAMDDRMLRDIGIGRGNIPYIAESLAYGEHRAAGTETRSEAIPAKEVFLTMRAA